MEVLPGENQKKKNKEKKNICTMFKMKLYVHNGVKFLLSLPNYIGFHKISCSVNEMVNITKRILFSPFFLSQRAKV